LILPTAWNLILNAPPKHCQCLNGCWECKMPSNLQAPSSTLSVSNEHLRRWRLILGEDAAETMGFALDTSDAGMDAALGALYGDEQTQGRSNSKKGGLGSSAPNVARWLGDIRNYFPSSVVRVMQQDALERLDLKQLLLEREMLEALQPDVHLVATLVALKSAIPAKTRETARLVVQRVVEEL